MSKTKYYRVNSSEAFNLDSMYTHLLNDAYDMEHDTKPWDDALYAKFEEVRDLMDYAYVGARVTWPQLKRIREIRAERQMMRYACAMQSGETEARAAMAFDL